MYGVVDKNDNRIPYTGTAAWRKKKKSFLPFLEFPFQEFIFYRLGLSTNTAIEPGATTRRLGFGWISATGTKN